jgi:outer membrane protein assembly factor BamB
MGIVAVAFAGVCAQAADWPQWRGPHRDAISHETGLLKEWPAEGPHVVWTATNLGGGYSTVAVAGKRLFTTGDRTDACFVLAFDASSGKPLWTAKLGKPGAPGWGGFAGPRSTPTVEGDSLYAVGQYGELVCLEAATGRQQWSKDFIKDFGGTRPEWGFSESPLVDEDKVIITPGGEKGAIVALNKKTGAEIWRSKEFKDLAHYSSLMPADIGGTRQYVQLTSAPKTVKSCGGCRDGGTRP